MLPPSNLTTSDGDTTWEGPNCEITWSGSAGAYYAGYSIDEVIKGYQVEILRSSDDEPLRTQALGNVTDYIYTYEMNVEDNYAADSSGPTRGLKITVYAISVYDETETTGVTATLTNPIPVIVGAPTVEAMFQGVKIDWRNITPADNDGSKFVIYCDTDTPPSSGVGTNDWLTRTWYETGLDTDDVYYAQIEPYDGFGVGTKSSVSTTFEPLKVAEVDIDGELSSSIAMSDSLGTSASGLAVLYDRTIDSGGITYSGTGWVDYDFGIEDLKDGVKVYIASGTRMYVSYAGNDDVRHYLSGEADHTLDTEGAMVSRASEALAITNYLTVDAGKVVPKFPQRIIASSCRIHFTIEAILYELVFEREVVAELVVADSLSAISANIGTVTAGLIQSDDGNTIFDLDEGYIRVTDDLDVTRVLLGKIS